LVLEFPVPGEPDFAEAAAAEHAPQDVTGATDSHARGQSTLGQSEWMVHAGSVGIFGHDDRGDERRLSRVAKQPSGDNIQRGCLTKALSSRPDPPRRSGHTTTRCA